MSAVILEDCRVPNLDRMSARDLLRFWITYRDGASFAGLFYKQGKGSGSKDAAVSLARFAYAKRSAMLCRAKGDLIPMRFYTETCATIYANLPAYAQWRIEP